MNFYAQCLQLQHLVELIIVHVGGGGVGVHVQVRCGAPCARARQKKFTKKSQKIFFSFFDQKSKKKIFLTEKSKKKFFFIFYQKIKKKNFLTKKSKIYFFSFFDQKIKKKKIFFDQNIKKKSLTKKSIIFFSYFERFLFTDMFYRVCSSHCTSLGGRGLV